MESNNNPIDDKLDSLKPSILPQFVTKWSKHRHLITNPLCNYTLTMDGDWKLGRPKCLHGDVFYNSTEFGAIKIGCRNSPARLSYYCNEHRHFEAKFSVNESVIAINPANIKLQKLGFAY